MIRPGFIEFAMHARMNFTAAFNAKVAETNFPFGQGRAAEGAHSSILGSTPICFKHHTHAIET